MAMSVLNNPTAKMTLGELNKNITAVGKQLRKVSSGQRIFGAGDGASEYAISEKMRTQLRGLGQDIQNVRTGTSLLRVAEGGMQSIIDEIRNMKELALNAANDHNTDLDRAVLQKDFEQRVANIEDISATTNYNGKILLKGDYNESRELLSRIKIPVVTPVTDTHRVRRQTGTRETQVTVDSPSVTKIKNSDGTTAIRQNNDVSGLATGFSPLYGSCTKTGTMKSGGQIDCDYGI